MISRNHFFGLLGGAALSFTGLGATMAQDVVSSLVYVGNLAPSVTEAELEALFSNFGSVSSVRIPKDRATGLPKGFAFVQMQSYQEANAAISQLNGEMFAGRPLTVKATIPGRN